jgi:hypothetical protein
MLGALLRLYSYAYEFILALFLFLISVVVLIGGKHQLSLTMLPWEGASLTYWLFGLSLTGMVITALAVLGKLRQLFPVWCLFVVVMMARGFFLSPYYYSGGSGQFNSALALFIGALVALGASVTLLKRGAR